MQLVIGFFVFLQKHKNINIMKYYIKWFQDFGVSVYPIDRFKKGFDLVFICVTISIDYGNNSAI